MDKFFASLGGISVSDLPPDDAQRLADQMRWGIDRVAQEQSNPSGIMAILDACIVLGEKELVRNLLTDSWSHSLKGDLSEYYEARLLLLDGQLEEARIILNRLWNNGAGLCVAGEGLCEILLQQNQLEYADKIASQLNEKSERKDVALKLRAAVLLGLRRLDEAQVTIEQLESLNPLQSEIAVLKVACSVANGNFRDAEEALTDIAGVSCAPSWSVALLRHIREIRSNLVDKA